MDIGEFIFYCMLGVTLVILLFLMVEAVKFITPAPNQDTCSALADWQITKNINLSSNDINQIGSVKCIEICSEYANKIGKQINCTCSGVMIGKCYKGE